MKIDTYVVFKREDLEKYCKAGDLNALDFICTKIKRGREADFKTSQNEYYVCNKDEHYADQVLQVILNGESHKSKIKEEGVMSELINRDKYVLNWNDECLDQSIIAGPLSNKQATVVLRDKMIDSIINSLSCSHEKACELLESAEKEDLSYDGTTITIHESGGSVSGNYEDRYQIVSFKATNETAVELKQMRI